MTTRLPVLKTYKLFIKGAFPRTESGRVTLIKNAAGEPLANICRASRKDFREAVVAARGARLGIPEVKRSLVAAGGALLRLPQRIPYGVAMELAFTGDPITAERAADLGLVGRSHDRQHEPRLRHLALVTSRSALLRPGG